MVKLNIFSSTTSHSAAETPSSENRKNDKQKMGSNNKFGSGGPVRKMTTPMSAKPGQNDESRGKRMAQSEPRKPFQRSHFRQQQQTPNSATKSILKVPNGGLKNSPSSTGGGHRQGKHFGGAQKRRVSFGSQSESNDSAVKAHKMPKVEMHTEEMDTPKIGQQKFQQKMNGSASGKRIDDGSQKKKVDEQKMALQQQPTAQKDGAIARDAFPTPPTGPAKKQKQPKQKQPLEVEQPKAIPKAGPQQSKGKAKAVDQQKLVSKSEQNGGPPPMTKREKKRLAKKEHFKKTKELRKQKHQPGQKQTDQPEEEKLKKNDKKSHMKLARDAAERLQEALQMIRQQKEGGGTATADNSDNSKKDMLFNMIGSSLEHLLPVRFTYGRFRFSSRLLAQSHSHSIVHTAALLEPKKFKHFVRLLTDTEEGGDEKGEDGQQEGKKGSAKKAKGKRELQEPRTEEEERRHLAVSLCVLSAALCLLGNALPDEGDTARRREEYLSESTELRKMTKNLLGDAAVDAQQQLAPLVADMVPVLVDLVIAWASRPAYIHRTMGAFVVCRFAKWINRSHFEPILKVFVEKDAELLKEEQQEEEDDDEEDDDEDGEENDEDKDEEEEEEETSDLNPKLVADVRRAMGRVAMPKDKTEVPSDDDNWEMSDAQMFRLDHDLARAFRKHSSKRSDLSRQANILRLRMTDLVSVYVYTGPFDEAMSLTAHILSSVVWRINANHKRLGIQLVDPLLQRKRENTAPIKRIVKLFKQLIDGAAGVDEEQQKAQRQPQQIVGRREALGAVLRFAQMLFSLASDHTEHKCAPELLRFVEQKVVNDYFSADEDTNKALLQSSFLNRICETYPQYLDPKFLLTLLAFTTDDKLSDNRKQQAFNLARILLSSKKETPKLYAPVLDDIGKYLADAVPLFIKKAPSATEDDQIHRTRVRMLVKFVFILGWFFKTDLASEASKNAIRQAVAKVGLGSMDEQQFEQLLGPYGMKELRHCLKMHGAMQQFGGDKMVAQKFVAELGPKLATVKVDEEEEETDEEDADDEEEAEGDDDEGGEESDDEMEDEEEEEDDDEEEEEEDMDDDEEEDE